MIEIPEPPDIRACSPCMSPLLWLYSHRTGRWVAFVPNPSDPRSIRPHQCSGGIAEPRTWREFLPRTEPDPAIAERVHAGIALAREVLAGKTENDDPSPESRKDNE